MALLIVGAVGLCLGYVVSIRPERPGRFSQPISTKGRWAYFVLLAGYVVLLAGFAWWRSTFLSIGHYSAALVLLLAMAVVVVLNGLELEKRNQESPGRSAGLRRWYWGASGS